MPPRQQGKTLLLLLVLTAAAGAVAWWYFAPRSLPQVLQVAAPQSPNAAPALYKWRDAKGRLNVTDQPPSDRPYETVIYDPNTNLMPSITEPDMPPTAPPAPPED